MKVQEIRLNGTNEQNINENNVQTPKNKPYQAETFNAIYNEVDRRKNPTNVVRTHSVCRSVIFIVRSQFSVAVSELHLSTKRKHCCFVAQ